MPFFLKRKEILRKNRDIEAIFARNNKIVGKFVLIYFNQGEKRKVAFILSKKIDKRAVVRNKVRRWLKEIYRQGKLSLGENIELLIIARHEIINAKYEMLKDEIEGLFNNINYRIN